MNAIAVTGRPRSKPPIMVTGMTVAALLVLAAGCGESRTFQTTTAQELKSCYETVLTGTAGYMREERHESEEIDWFNRLFRSSSRRRRPPGSFTEGPTWSGNTCRSSWKSVSFAGCSRYSEEATVRAHSDGSATLTVVHLYRSVGLSDISQWGILAIIAPSIVKESGGAEAARLGEVEKELQWRRKQRYSPAVSERKRNGLSQWSRR